MSLAQTRPHLKQGHAVCSLEYDFRHARKKCVTDQPLLSACGVDTSRAGKATRMSVNRSYYRSGFCQEQQWQLLTKTCVLNDTIPWNLSFICISILQSLSKQRKCNASFAYCSNVNYLLSLVFECAIPWNLSFICLSILQSSRIQSKCNELMAFSLK